MTPVRARLKHVPKGSTVIVIDWREDRYLCVHDNGATQWHLMSAVLIIEPAGEWRTSVDEWRTALE